MGKWLGGIKDAVEEFASILPLSLQWLMAGLVVFIIALLIWGIVQLFGILF